VFLPTCSTDLELRIENSGESGNLQPRAPTSSANPTNLEIPSATERYSSSRKGFEPPLAFRFGFENSAVSQVTGPKKSCKSSATNNAASAVEVRPESRSAIAIENRTNSGFWAVRLPTSLRLFPTGQRRRPRLQNNGFRGVLPRPRTAFRCPQAGDHRLHRNPKASVRGELSALGGRKTGTCGSWSTCHHSSGGLLRCSAVPLFR
jgi:hypothetical protein